MTDQLHNVLLTCGFKYTLGRKMPRGSLLYTNERHKGYYVKDYETEAGIFSIALVLSSDPYVKLPFAYVLNIPEKYSGRLIPHITNEYNLCYVSQMEADWDSNDLNVTYRDVDAQIQLTLNNAVTSVERGDSNDTELDGEFFAYWKSEATIYLLAKPEKNTSLSTWLVEATHADGSIHQEYVTTEKKQDEFANWLLYRGFTADNLKGMPIVTHYITVKPTRLTGIVWPPEAFSDILSWLSEVDHIARDNIIKKLLSNIRKRHVFLLDINSKDILAIYIELNTNTVNLNRHSGGKKRKSSMQYLVSLLGSKSVSVAFRRLGVVKADYDTILSRSKPRQNNKSISNKNIALIGCGTIGGYLSALLLRSGAGCGEKKLHLFDGDFLSAQNFSRHILTANEFGKNKALALSDYLMKSIHIAKNIKGIPFEFPINKETLTDYDIIIDATGRPPVSRRLAAVIRTLPITQRPILIHAFNDGNGRASKVLIDDGSCCYGCMLSEPAFYHNSVDLRFVDIDQSTERRIGCGSVYTPYDAAVSNITAALAQEAVLNTLEQKIAWTYNEHMLDGSRSRRPRYLKCQPTCRICHE
ncbi:hypothetical protein JAF85_003161 [Citrobacter werkmanii]|nr:hypothetical protein [Citrobacter werkmanii]EGT0672393.1 hypothetical protein [Citrobacter werkmanii]